MDTFVETLPPRLSESFRCFDRRENRLPARFHQHPEIELTYVPNGGGRRLIGDHVDRYQDHDLVLVGENLPHNWSADEFRGQPVDMHEAVVMYFRRDFLGRGFFDIPEAARIRELFDTAQRGIWFPPDTAAEIGERMRRIMRADGMQRVAELLLCLERLCDCHQARLLASEGFVVCHRESADSRMTVALDYINRHFRDWELRASQLATLVNMNGSAFSRRFRNVTGHTPTTYINRVRLGYSRRLLLDQASSVTDVCHESGFSSLSHFSKLFRARYEMSPSEFREAHLVACNSASG